jgi:hypothetical protein
MHSDTGSLAALLLAAAPEIGGDAAIRHGIVAGGLVVHFGQ